VVRRFTICLLLLLASCTQGPVAPPSGEAKVACIDPVCISYPGSWDVGERGPDFITFSHPGGSGRALATVGPVNMQAVVESAGESWPVTADRVVLAFWQLLEDADVASFERMERLIGGGFRSEGSYEDGRLWHLLIPGQGSDAIAIEVRGPNPSWDPHADVFFADNQYR